MLNTLAARKAGIERVLAEAKEAEERASALKDQFEGRLADWEREKAAARSQFDAQMAAEHARQMEELNRDLAAERQRSAARDAHRQETLRRELAARPAPWPASSPAHCSARRRRTGRKRGWSKSSSRSWGRCPRSVWSLCVRGQNGHARGVFATAFPLPQALRARLAAAVEARLGMHGEFDFVEDSALLAGVRLSLGAWQLDFSVAGELGAFAESGSLGG
ncbi:MAG: F0F1 ATP synthase subunit delta [Gammaproteobacteria bacterium]|nr:F0F1 ATP synthase subunit delta [Gammaproteobacteria bacterium]